MRKILVVDDEPAIRELLKEFLESENYRVETAEGGIQALAALEKDPDYDLVISDIKMPGMLGFELLAKIEEKYPSIRRVLITAYNPEEYISIAVKHGVSNIIAKTTPFNFNDVSAIVRSLSRGDIFGIPRFLNGRAEIRKIPVMSPRKARDYAMDVIRGLDMPPETRNMELAIVELLNNAIRVEDFPPGRGEVEICYAKDDEKYAVAVVENRGRFNKEKVLFWLDRQTATDTSGQPLGILDVTGRGGYSSRQTVDRLIVNIKKQKCTEIICLDYFEKAVRDHKPLLINEI
jgi:CheY-like chemotaxis protein/anti-sigma regulatory factor (Ser/Thr protein kinase)